jgi:hypothetical protein
MTESEWLECEDPTTMLEFLNGKASERKLRLFACACCRTMWSGIPLGDHRSSVLAAERYCDGFASFEELGSLRNSTEREIQQSRNNILQHPISFKSHSLYAPLLAAAYSIDTSDESGLTAASGTVEESERADGGQGTRHLCNVLRCVIRNPFPIIFMFAAWLTPTVLSLAQSAYDERIMPSGELDPARLAVLSDALEEAGCDDNDILDHLRSPGPHVRGCWAVDLVLGKE